MSRAHTTCAECRALIGGYVLDALEPEEMETVRRHLAECSECAAEHATLDGVPALLDIAGADDADLEKPPDALEEAVLDNFAREHRTDSHGAGRIRRRARRALGTLRRPIPAAFVGAAAAAAVTLAIVLPLTTGGGSSGGETYQAALVGTPAAPDAHAAARLVTSTDGTKVHMKVHGLRGNPDNVYELWCIRDDGWKISAGTFRVDGDGNAYVNLTTAATPGEYHRLGIERKTQSSPGGVPVMAGEVRFPTS